MLIDASTLGFIFRHHVERAGDTAGVNHRLGTARAFGGDFLPCGLAGVMHHHHAAVAFIGNASQLLRHQIHRGVVIFIDAVNALERVDDEHVNLAALDFCNDAIDQHSVDGDVALAVTVGGDGPRPLAPGVGKQAATKVGWNELVGDAAAAMRRSISSRGSSRLRYQTRSGLPGLPVSSGLPLTISSSSAITSELLPLPPGATMAVTNLRMTDVP